MDVTPPLVTLGMRQLGCTRDLPAAIARELERHQRNDIRREYFRKDGGPKVDLGTAGKMCS